MSDCRKYGLDILRIISMIFVIGLHYFFNCSINEFQTFSFNFVVNWFLEVVCYTSVDIFILITGYFGICSHKQNYSRLVSLAISVWFYSWILLIFAVLLRRPVSLFNLLVSAFPLIHGHYWFISVYFILSFIRPKLNSLVSISDSDSPLDESLRESSSINKLLLVLMLLFCLIPTFFPKADQNFVLSGGTNIVWFISLYFLGGAIRVNNLGRIKKCFVFVVLIISLLIPFLIKIVAMKWFGISNGGAVFYHHNSLFIVVASVCMVLLFKDIQINNESLKRVILLISNATFGVYLLHENIFVKDVLWSKIRVLQDLTSPLWGVYAILVVLSIFVLCTMIELVRLYIFRCLTINEKAYNLFYKIYNKAIARRINGKT